MHSIMIAAFLAVATTVSGYDYSGPGLATWPSTGGYGYGSTCWGCHGFRIGKRSADAHGYGYGGALTLQNHNNVHGHQYGSGYAISQPHPGHSGSYQQVSRLHSGIGHYGKRSAHGYGYGGALTLQNHNNVYGHQYGSGYAISQPHPGHSGSYQQVSKLHSGIGHGYGYGHHLGKRSADAHGYGYGVAVIAPHTVENHNNVHGHELGSGYAISQPHPGQSGSYQQVSRLHPGYGIGYGHGHYGKRSAYGYGYGGALTLQNHNNVYGHQYGSGYTISQPHPGHSGSYQQVSKLHSGIGHGYGHF